jgi:ligand-binding sensor domain-containing protein
MRACLIALSIFLPVQVHAQVFTQYTPDNSVVPDLLIHTVYTAPDESVWIGTENGLVVVDDAGSWQLYNTANSGLPDNSVRSVLMDNAGTVWIGTFLGGLAKFSGGDWTIFNTDNSGLPENYIRAINQDAQDSLWIGTTAGLARWDMEDDWYVFTMLNSGLLSNNITDIHIDINDYVYLGTINGGLSVYRDGIINYYRTENSFIADNTVLAIVEDAFQNKWMATAFGGLSIFTASEDFLNFTPFNSDIPDVEIDDVFLDNDGIAFMGMASTGLVAFDGTSWNIWNTDNSSIPANHIKTLTVDASNQVWIGTEDAGLVVFDRDAVDLSLHEQSLTSLYPNPAAQNIQVQTNFTGGYQWKIYNLQGVDLLKGRSNYLATSITIDQLPNGNYYLLLFPQHGEPVTRAFTVQHE